MIGLFLQVLDDAGSQDRSSVSEDVYSLNGLYAVLCVGLSPYFQTFVFLWIFKDYDLNDYFT